MYRTLIWATDGSTGADAALAEAVRLAGVTGARIFAVHCDQRPVGRAGGSPVPAEEDDLHAKIRRQADALNAAGVSVGVVIRAADRAPADVVAGAAADLDADLVVCGTRGRGAIAGVVLGSFTQRLLHVAPCPVLAVSESAGAARSVREYAGAAP